MPRFEAEVTVYFDADDLLDAGERYDAICDILADAGVSVSEDAEVGPAIETKD